MFGINQMNYDKLNYSLEIELIRFNMAKIRIKDNVV